jgi:hypothetical protein
MKERIKAWLKKVLKDSSIQPEDSKTALTLKLLYIVPLTAVWHLCISIYEMVKETSSEIQKEYKRRS